MCMLVVYVLYLHNSAQPLSKGLGQVLSNAAVDVPRVRHAVGHGPVRVTCAMQGGLLAGLTSTNTS